jgi:hypothetical protein
MEGFFRPEGVIEKTSKPVILKKPMATKDHSICLILERQGFFATLRMTAKGHGMACSELFPACKTNT